jgi:hypothetical protein
MFASCYSPCCHVLPKGFFQRHFLCKITLYSALTNEELVYMKQTWTRDRDRLKLASSKVGIAQLAVIKKNIKKENVLFFGAGASKEVGTATKLASSEVLTLDL